MGIQAIFIAALGWIAGWLINYLASVLPTQRRLSQPVCQRCGGAIPLSSFWFGRTCPDCGRKGSIRFWLVQGLTTAGFVYLWMQPSQRLGFWPAALLLTYLGVVMVIDIEHRLILHPVSLVGAGLGFGLGFWLHGFIPTLIGGAAGFGIMLLLYYFGDVYARWLARRRGEELEEVALGFGDVNLAGVLGLILGWPGVLAGLFLAVLLGGLISLLVMVTQVITRRYRPFTAIPYAPFLILGTVLLLYR